MKKKIIVSVIVILILIGVGSIAFHINQVGILTEELNQISLVMEDESPDFSQIDERLNTIKTKWEYAKIEQGVKKYFKGFIGELKNLDEISREERLSTILSVENFKEDGPKFEKTTEYIEEKISKLQSIKNNILEYFEDEKIDSYFKDTKKLFKDEFIKELKDNQDFKMAKDSIEKSLNEVIETLENSKEIIDFLKNNKEKWETDGKTIIFYSNDLLEKYNSLVDKL